MLKMKFSQKMRLLLEKRTIYLPQTKSPKSSNISTDNVHTSIHVWTKINFSMFYVGE